MALTGSRLHRGPLAAPNDMRRSATGQDRGLSSVLGNQGLLLARGSGVLQAKLSVSQPDDPQEQEAERVADEVMRMPLLAPGMASAVPPRVQRMCTTCEEELKRSELDAPDAAPTEAGPAAAPSSEPVTALEQQVHALRGRGHPLPAAVRADMEPHFGADFSAVRVHNDGSANELARSLGAQAFAVGNDLVFGAGQFAPQSPTGRHLLAHELTHVLQQSGGSSSGVAPRIQRTTHSGTTPTNCHNWKIPLPPWIAGTIAHGQIASLLGIPPADIPRASKLLMGLPNPPAIAPMGFADLFQSNPASIGIAEIKSTYTGDAVAQAEAAHYTLRHTEWLTRAPWTGDATDLGYLGRVGGPFPGGILDLSPRTGTDLNLGMFWGDPLKQLHIEGDALGSVVYWCTGAGLPGSPLWYPVFRRLMNELKDLLKRAKETLQGVLEGVTAAAASAWATIRGWIGDVVDWGMAHSRALAFLMLILILLAAIVVLIVSILAEAPSAGTSTVPLVASLAAMAGAVSGMLVLLGISSPDLPSATTTVAMAMVPDQADAAASGADYERDTLSSAGRFPSSQAAASAVRPDPAGDFMAAIAPARDPLAIFQAVAGSFTAVPPGGVRKLTDGIALLESNGDGATAAFLRTQAAANGLT